jgi:sulfur-oxidizing protein SoxZ
MARALVSVPTTARRGETVEVRAQIAHPMETGYRAAPDGTRVPRDILRRITCRYGGELVLAADLHPAIAANPYFAFHVVVDRSSSLEITWEGDNGFAQTEAVAISVT